MYIAHPISKGIQEKSSFYLVFIVSTRQVAPNHKSISPLLKFVFNSENYFLLSLSQPYKFDSWVMTI